MRVAVVIPCFRVSRTLPDVVRAIGPEVSAIYCVDDACPDRSGDVAERIGDGRIRVIRHASNRGVGGAVLTGYEAALRDAMDVVVKLDGDGQVNPALIPQLVAPILMGQADYVKGNRFYRLSNLRAMPWARLLGNAGLSFLTKLSSGYWNLFDPTNGFTAIDGRVARELPREKVHRGYFFESDMLYQLNLLRAVVSEVPMQAVYGDEVSNLSVLRTLFVFPFLHARNLLARLVYNYFLRNFSVASLHLSVGLPLLGGGTVFGAVTWYVNHQAGKMTSIGTVMLAVLPIILGSQLVLSFLAHDVASAPDHPIGTRLSRLPDGDEGEKGAG